MPHPSNGESDFWSGWLESMQNLSGIPEQPLELSPSETLYRHYAEPLVAAGWSAFPQSILNGRKPGTVGGRGIQVSQYIDKRPTLAEARKWGLENSTFNAAILLGPASGGTFVIDGDIDDRDMAFGVREILLEELGPTPFERIGRWPRFALVYRGETDIRGRSIHFAGNDGEASPHALEILSKGKALTAMGRHHLTGQMFKWLGADPRDVGPEAAPYVSEAQLTRALERVHATYPMWSTKSAKSGPVHYETVDVAGVLFPKISNVFGAWQEKRGMVTDGRESFLWSMCRETVRRNPGLAACTDGQDMICRVVVGEFVDRIALSGRWSARYIRHAVEQKVARAAAQLLDGSLSAWKLQDANGIAASEPVFDTAGRNAFPWLTGRRAELRVKFNAGSAIERQARQLVTDRSTAELRTQAAISRVHEEYLEEVYAGTNGIHLLLSPTGSGKTVKTLHRLAGDPRTHEWDGRESHPDNPGPFLYLLPTFKNIDELRAKAEVINLNPALPDAELLDAARGKGLILEEDLSAAVSSLRRDARDAGLETVVYAGKVTAGCKKADKVEALMAAGVPTSGLCKTTMGDGAMRSTSYCEFYESCPAIAQRHAAKNAHVVFLPRNFLDLKIPEEITKSRGVIADESIFSLLVHTSIFPQSALWLERPEIRLTDDEIGNGLKASYVADFRDAAARIVNKAFREGIDPAKALKDYTLTGPNRSIPGKDLAKYAKRICSQGIINEARIHPNLTMQAIGDIVSKKPTEHVKAEFRFWSLILERMEALEADEAEDAILPRLPASRTASDLRIQFLDGDTDSPSIRVSWLTEANWQKSPMLLLDASGDPDIIRRVFPGRKVTVHRVPVDLNLDLMVVPDMRFAVRSVCPGLDASPEDKFNAAKLVHEIRTAISLTAGIYAHGHVVVGMPKKMRKVVQKGWEHPANVQFMHSMAFAGLDFARQHVFALSFGRMELPTREIDSQVAALTHGDVNPELPIDALGTGVDALGDRIYPHVVRRTVMMRDGRDGSFDTHEHAGPVARALQAQYREEQIRQFIGRLRAVYRGDTPGAMIVGQAVPEDLVVDQVCSWEDLLRSGADMWDAVRRCGGMINAQMMAAAAPETATEEACEAWIASLGDVVLDRYSRIFSNYGLVYVPGHYAVPEAALRAWGARWGIAMEIRSCQVCTHRAPAAPEGRPNDDIEEKLGKRDERRDAEDAAIAAVTKRIGGADYKSGKGVYRAGTGELRVLSAQVGVWAVLDTMDDPWIYSDKPPVEVATDLAATG